MKHLHILALFGILVVMSLTNPAFSHILPDGNADHSHDHAHSDLFDPYSADTGQPIYTQLAECAAIYASAADKGPDAATFVDPAYQKELEEHAPKLKDKAVSIARKKDHDAPERVVSETYARVYKIWSKRWVFEEDQAHYALMAENQKWLTYCQKLGLTFNALPHFPNDPE